MCFSRAVGRSENPGGGGACCNVVGITVHLVDIGLADLPKLLESQCPSGSDSPVIVIAVNFSM